MIAINVWGAFVLGLATMRFAHKMTSSVFPVVQSNRWPLSFICGGFVVGAVAGWILGAWIPIPG